jgi:hypothetical protein
VIRIKEKHEIGRIQDTGYKMHVFAQYPVGRSQKCGIWQIIFLMISVNMLNLLVNNRRNGAE